MNNRSLSELNKKANLIKHNVKIIIRRDLGHTKWFSISDSTGNVKAVFAKEIDVQEFLDRMSHQLMPSESTTALLEKYSHKPRARKVQNLNRPMRLAGSSYIVKKIKKDDDLKVFKIKE